VTAGLRPKALPGKRYFFGLILPVGVLLLLIAFFNTWVNPLWVATTSWSSPAFASYKPLHKALRTAKPGLARSFQWDGVMLGTSRVDIAFDPTLPEWEGKRVANFALRGGTICEHEAMLRYAVAHQQRLEFVVLGVDLSDLTSPVNITPGTGFDESPLAQNGNRLEREIRYVVGVSMFADAVKCMNYRRKGRLGAYTPEGQWVRQLDKRPMRTVLSHESFKWAGHFAAQRRKSIKVNPVKVEALRNILRLCREKNMRLHVCIPPSHAAYLSAMRLNGEPDPVFRVDRSQILAVLEEELAAHPGSKVELWDFNDFHPLNCDPLPGPEEKHTYFWADGTHALPPLGHIMLARMMGWPVPDARGADYGVKLTPGGLEARLRQIDDGYPRYQTEHAEDFAWVREHLRDFEKKKAR
jgi:hypothetical protein